MHTLCIDNHFIINRKPKHFSMNNRLTSPLLKFIPLCIACLYPSIAMAEPQYEDYLLPLGGHLLKLFSLFLFVPISIFVIWLLPYTKKSSCPELTRLYILNTIIDVLALIVSYAGFGPIFVILIIPIMLIKFIMYLKKSNSIKSNRH